MGAIRHPETAPLHALNEGVDLALIALDSDLYFSCMAKLLEAHAAGQLDEVTLTLSDNGLKESR